MRFCVSVSELRAKYGSEPGEMEYVFGKWRKIDPQPEVKEAAPVAIKPVMRKRVERWGGFRPGMLSQNGNW